MMNDTYCYFFWQAINCGALNGKACNRRSDKFKPKTQMAKGLESRNE